MSLAPRIDNLDRNYIINGNFDHWQRGTSSSAAGYVVADRWYIANNGGTITTSRQTDATEYFLRCVKGAATLIDIRQGVELPIRGNPGDFSIGSKFTICFDAKSAVGGESLTADAYFRAGVASGTATNISSAGSITLTTSWQRYMLTYTIDAAPGVNDPGIFFVLRTAATQLDIKKVALYKGEFTTVPEFNRAGRNTIEELQLCQRYYQKSGTVPGSEWIPGVATNAAIDNRYTGRLVVETDRAYISETLKVQMRNNPTVTFYPGRSDVTNTADRIAVYNSNILVTFSSSFSFGTSALTGTFQTLSTSASAYSFQYTADAEL